MKTAYLAIVALGFGLLSTSVEARTPAPEGAKAYIVSPKNGDKVKSPLTVVFGLENMGVAPAGVMKKHTGHHHLLINVDKLPRMNAPLPANDNIVHFGGGQTQVTKELKPGKYTLQLLLGDHVHVPHEPPILSEKIEIEVVE